MSYFYSVLGIIVCGGAGGAIGWAAASALGMDGVGGSLLAAVIAMVVAVALWAFGTTLLRKLHVIR